MFKELDVSYGVFKIAASKGLAVYYLPNESQYEVYAVGDDLLVIARTTGSEAQDFEANIKPTAKPAGSRNDAAVLGLLANNAVRVGGQVASGSSTGTIAVPPPSTTTTVTGPGTTTPTGAPP